MARNVKAGIEIEVDVKKGTKSIATFADRFKGAMSAVGGAVTAANQGIELLTKVIGTAVGVIKDVVAAASQQEEQNLRLAASLRLAGEEVDSNVDKLGKFNSALQAQLGVDDDFLADIQGMFLGLGLTADQLEDATKATIGWAKIVGKDMKSAALDVSKALQGNVLMLRRYGLDVNNSEEATAALLKTFKLAEEQSGTFATRMRVLNANFGDFQEQLGFTIIESENGRQAIDELNQGILALIDIVQSSEGKAAINEFFGAISRGARDARLLMLSLLGEIDRAAVGLSMGRITEEIDTQAKLVLKLRRDLGDLSNAYDEAADAGLRLEIDLEIQRVTEAIENELSAMREFGATAEKVEARILELTVKRGERQKKETDKERKAREKAAKATLKAQEKAERASEKLAQKAFDFDRELALKETKEEQKRLSALMQQEIEFEKRTQGEIESLRDERAALKADFDRDQARAEQDIADNSIAVQQAQTEKRGQGFEALGEEIRDGVAAGFAGAIVSGENFGDAMQRLAERVSTSFLTTAFTNILGSIFGGPAGLLGGLFGGLFEKGGAVGAPRQMAHGGIITGGRPGVDSVLVAAQEGEAFLPANLTKALMDVLGSRGGSSFQGGGVVSGGGGTTIVVQSLVFPTRSQFQRATRDEGGPNARRARRRGIKT